MDEQTLEALAELICGDDEETAPLYRSSSNAALQATAWRWKSKTTIANSARFVVWYPDRVRNLVVSLLGHTNITAPVTEPC